VKENNMADNVIRLRYRGRNSQEQVDVSVPNGAEPGEGTAVPGHLEHVSPAGVLTADVRQQIQDDPAGRSNHVVGTQTTYHLRAGDVIAVPAAHAAWLLAHPTYRHHFRQTDEAPRRATDAVDVGHHP
jgi:hypothetical protein